MEAVHDTERYEMWRILLERLMGVNAVGGRWLGQAEGETEGSVAMMRLLLVVLVFLLALPIIILGARKDDD